MKRMFCLSSKEALLIQSALSDYVCKLSYDLSDNDDPLILDDIVVKLHHCDSLRLKISKSFPDLSVVD